ncbi:MAG: hypothetical protein EPO26_03040 [Chloroflexota bacterium]|nr:MAG: hypothetical protein EPO26_03040 [Chloroflexota bacterium]
MAIISASALREVETALLAYERAVDESALAQKSSVIRKQVARYFVRWLKGDYQPGQGLRR